MNLRNQTLLVGDTPQQTSELWLFLLREPRKECLLVLARDATNSLDSSLACVRQV